MARRTTIRRTTATLLGLVALTAGGTHAPASADDASAAGPVGIAGRTSTTALCSGGGSVAVTTRPAEAHGRVVVSVRASGVAPGSRWRGQLRGGLGPLVDVPPVVARAGRWSVTRTIDARRVQSVSAFFHSGRRGACSTLVKRRSPLVVATVCPGREDTGATLVVRDTEPSPSARVVLGISTDAPARSRWTVTSGYSVAGEDGSTTGATEQLGADGGVRVATDVPLRGEATLSGVAVGRLDGEVVGRCRISLAGRFTR